MLQGEEASSYFIFHQKVPPQRVSSCIVQRSGLHQNVSGVCRAKAKNFLSYSYAGGFSTEFGVGLTADVDSVEGEIDLGPAEFTLPPPNQL